MKTELTKIMKQLKIIYALADDEDLYGIEEFIINAVENLDSAIKHEPDIIQYKQDRYDRDLIAAAGE